MGYTALNASEVLDCLYLLKYFNNNTIDTKDKDIYKKIQKDLPTVFVYCIGKWHKYYGVATDINDIDKLLNKIIDYDKPYARNSKYIIPYNTVHNE